VKVIVDEDTDKPLGAAIIGPYATDLIQKFVAGIKIWVNSKTVRESYTFTSLLE
jgi:pyruvate/2-oxoglutarate dehydrogenase complex dihydrolipoamide dehydrogenase (E3) component